MHYQESATVVMRQIDQFFYDKPRSTLFHYTGIGALLGIADSNSLWASCAYYLNDAEEISYACKVLDKMLQDYQIANNRSEEENEFLANIKEWVSSCRTTTYNIFIFSLSEEKSLLSQWRSYTPHGKGISIGFSPKLVNRVRVGANMRLAKCIYDIQDQEELIHSLVNKMLVTFNQDKHSIDISRNQPTQKYHQYLEGFRGDVLQILAIIKHQAFSEEKEWRLVSAYHPKYTVPSIKFRQGASMLVPYIELPLGDVRPYFETVVLGPSPHQNLSFSALSMLLSNKNLCTTTENSSLPYREW